MILVFWMLSLKPIFSLSSFTFIWRLFSSSSLSAMRVVSSAHIAAAKSLQSCPTLCDPKDGSPPVSPSLGFSRQEHWSGLPFPSPMHESEKWKWSRSVVSDSSRPHELQPIRLLRPWDFPGKSTGVGCHCLLCLLTLRPFFNRRVRPKWENFPGGASDKEPVCQCWRHQRLRLDPWVGKIPWRRAWQQPALVFLPGESHGQRNLQSMGSWSVRHDWSNLACTHIGCTSRLPWGSHQGEKKHDHAQKWS